jgi:hypothetical protein
MPDQEISHRRVACFCRGERFLRQLAKRDSLLARETRRRARRPVGGDGYHLEAACHQIA